MLDSLQQLRGHTPLLHRSYVLSEVLKAGFTAPTPIQSQGWPMALRGRDLIGLAETGSGKCRVMSPVQAPPT